MIDLALLAHQLHETFATLLEALKTYSIAYLHVIRMPSVGFDSLVLARDHFDGILIGNDSFTAEEADQMIREGLLDALAFGRAFVAKPDLPERFKMGAPLAKIKFKTLYGGGAEGYTDYPSLAES